MTNKTDVTPSEALYGFVAWLTARFDQATFSQHNSSAEALELVERYRKANGWDPPRPDREDNLQMPSLQD